jgi:hypothetical protein
VGTPQSEDDNGTAIPFAVNKKCTLGYKVRTFRHFPSSVEGELKTANFVSHPLGVDLQSVFIALNPNESRRL